MSNLAFGYNQGLPEGVSAAWGARLIFPDDLLWDRQGNFGETTALHQWLNGGALKEALANARALAGSYQLQSKDTHEVVLYEDADGKIVGNPNGSFGYLYVAAWLFKDTAS